MAGRGGGDHLLRESLPQPLERRTARGARVAAVVLGKRARACSRRELRWEFLGRTGGDRQARQRRLHHERRCTLSLPLAQRFLRSVFASAERTAN
jgi:hypothetical protein